MGISNFEIRPSFFDSWVNYSAGLIELTRFFGFSPGENFTVLSQSYGQSQSGGLVGTGKQSDRWHIRREPKRKSFDLAAASAHARRHRARPDNDREWYHVMTSSADGCHLEQVLHYSSLPFNITKPGLVRRWRVSFLWSSSRQDSIQSSKDPITESRIHTTLPKL